MMEIDGGCHCGWVTYRAHIDPEKVSICHCTDCQKLTGSPYRVTVLCSADQIRMTGEEATVYAKTGDNGRRRFQHFCGECGSPLFSSGEEGGGDDWGIRWGSIRPSAANSSRRGKSGAAPPRPGSMMLGICREGRAIRGAAFALGFGATAFACGGYLAPFDR